MTTIPSLADLQARYAALQGRGLKLDMTRGKPAPEQLDLSEGLAALPGNRDHRTEAGEDARNYGGVQGLAEVRALFAPVLGAAPERIVVGNNSSLALMHDCIVYALLKGVPGGQRPWSKEEEIRFLCPVPGYDRHFALCETYGIGMVPVPMTADGPDMDVVEREARDPRVKGMWAVPQYSNPGGETYSDATVERLARMETGAPDFRLFWDNAYALHHLTERRPQLRNILDACTDAGHPDRAIVFASTSKVTLAGAGLAMLASSEANIRWYLGNAGKRTIGPDKLNQLRHIRFLRDQAGLDALMDGHRRLLAPKFRAVTDTLARHLGGTGVARWSEPEGGYFILLEVPEGCATRVVTLAAACGLALTPAGATHPYGRDPQDRLLRLAPSYPKPAEVEAAAEVVATCVLLAAAESREAGGSGRVAA
ncbi:DNA-binding transcriptional regulator, MocR family, contains an aminotransferase domain [Methylobacterium sp. 174MFSha1.1]|uniref:aminotransferase class I/II-fold pyridoxal phosphate-dependent enzyme n=1 Tax=Methylobacterium sp. 174MFSha1.1 TaxID=1502749 RepID=UPI0008F17FA6|nr:aminotransferase class I/II-fold pyridoxal phosphate-dependent enzyme [Methylobacterium sp. 174MFSha1.1]SFV04841.1 DNA-binding transcriptional regulator, MocR family, contains an aminotransferase domain [Methylobacterium sp. 174MFSha1.1]